MYEVYKKRVEKLNQKEWNKEEPFTCNIKDKSNYAVSKELCALEETNYQRKKAYKEDESFTNIKDLVPENSVLHILKYFIDCEASEELSNMVYLLNSSNGDLTSATGKLGRDIKYKHKWEDLSEGLCVPILKDKSMYMQFKFSKVNNKIIARYYVSSNKVDFNIANKWMKKNFFSKGGKKYEASAYLDF